MVVPGEKPMVHDTSSAQCSPRQGVASALLCFRHKHLAARQPSLQRADLRARRGFAMSGTPGATLETSYPRATRVHELHRKVPDATANGGLLTGEGADVS